MLYPAARQAHIGPPQQRGPCVPPPGFGAHQDPSSSGSHPGELRSPAFPRPTVAYSQSAGTDINESGLSELRLPAPVAGQPPGYGQDTIRFAKPWPFLRSPTHAGRVTQSVAWTPNGRLTQAGTRRFEAEAVRDMQSPSASLGSTPSRASNSICSGERQATVAPLAQGRWSDLSTADEGCEDTPGVDNFARHSAAFSSLPHPS
jgi:hypothetical protein